jgi:6-phosphogluconolactonase (cycloisomerase 2 family)
VNHLNFFLWQNRLSVIGRGSDVTWSWSPNTIDDNTGNLIPNSPATIVTGAQPWRNIVDPSGKFAYGVNENDAAVSVYTINSNGTLSAVGVAVAGNSPFAVAITAASH